MERAKTILLQESFDQPLDVVWEVLSDTERLNVAVGTAFTPYVAEDVLQEDGTVVRHARKRIGPFVLRWREGLGQWAEHRFVHHQRYFDNGPFRELSLKMVFADQGHRTGVDFEFLARWTSLLGDTLSLTGLLNTIASSVTAGARKLMDEQAAGPSEASPPVAVPKPKSNDARQRLNRAIAEVQAGAYASAMTQQLVDLLLSSHPLDLKRMRPLALAKVWGQPADEVVELFAAAHKAGLLAMRWEIMCPRCRGGKSRSLLLSDMPHTVHCDSCNIDYERDFATNVELVFSPSQWLRELPEGDFCLMSAAATPHVKLQCDLRPGETRVESVSFPDGRYRLRTLEAGGEREIDLRGGAVPAIEVSGADILLGDPEPAGEIRMANLGTLQRTVVIETLAWSADCLTGPAVIASPAFRDLFPEQLLRPDDDVEIDRVAILFSDLKGSTALYEAIGDSRAFALVREHFAYLEERIRRHRGVVVKTIGDAVMAAFRSGDAALAAALDIQDEVADFNSNREFGTIELKIGLHEGPCIAVTTRGVLDYFGATVNMAARLQSKANGGEIVLSEEVDASSLAARTCQSRNVVKDRASLAGFEQVIPFTRVLNPSNVSDSNG